MKKKKQEEEKEKEVKKEWRRGDPKEVGTKKILEMEESIWEERVRKNVSVKGLGPRNWVEGRVYTEERKGVFIIKREKGGSTSIHRGPTKKRVYPTL